MKESYETLEAYARMNYLIDVVRGNSSWVKWEFLDPGLKMIYREEASLAEYVLTEGDMDDFEQAMELREKP
jgi:hypothetical protein